jgi:hypothetical protein
MAEATISHGEGVLADPGPRAHERAAGLGASGADADGVQHLVPGAGLASGRLAEHPQVADHVHGGDREIDAIGPGDVSLCEPERPHGPIALVALAVFDDG